MITFATIYFRHHYDILSSGHIFAVIEFAYKGVCIVGQRFRSNSFGTSEIIMGFACRYSEQLNSLQDLSPRKYTRTRAHRTHTRTSTRTRTHLVFFFVSAVIQIQRETGRLFFAAATYSHLGKSFAATTYWKTFNVFTVYQNVRTYYAAALYCYYNNTFQV